jgi:hypothetical protein
VRKPLEQDRFVAVACSLLNVSENKKFGHDARPVSYTVNVAGREGRRPDRAGGVR